MKDYVVHEAGVLVAGSEGAGARAAIAASEMMVVRFYWRKPVQLFASSGFTNVTHRVPAFAFGMQTHPRGTRWHSIAVRDGSVEKLALDGMILAAKLLAASAIDVLAMHKVAN